MKKFWTSSLLFLAAGASAMGLASCNFLNALSYIDESLKGEEGLVFALTETQQSYAVTDYIGESESVEIPQTYQNLPVTEISGWAFNGKESVKTITIPESVTTIGDCAFSACVNLQSVDFRARVTRLGESVFGSCSSLEQLVLPDGLQTIDDNAFIFCENLQQIILPDTVTQIGTGVFDSCVKLSNVYYKGTQAQWGNLSIAQNNGELAAATTYYFSEEKPDDDADGDYWHYSAEGLVQNWILRSDGLIFALYDDNTTYCVSGYTGTDKDVVIPSKYNGKPVTKIGSGAFADKDITSVKFPQTLQSIDYNAFGGCESLTSVELPDNLTEIGSNAFASSGVQTIKLPANMTRIPDNAFMYMFNLKHISFPDSVIEIGENAFLDTGLESVDFNNVQKIENYAFYNTQLTSVVIPDCTKYIEQSAFENCTSLQRVILGTGVERIGTYAFSNLAPNAEIYYKGTLSEYANVTGSTNYNTFTYAATQPQGDGRYWYYNNGEITKWRWQTLGLQYINVADGYRQGYAVCGYTGGESEVVIPSIFQGQPVVEIYEEAFADKTHVTSISLPDSIVCIKEGAFRNCTGLLSLVIPDAVAYIQTGAFSGCTSLQSLTLPQPNGYYYDYTWQYATPFASIFGTDYAEQCNPTVQEYFGESNSYTQVSTYYVPNSLTNVTITGGDLAYGTFMNCTSLQTITLPTSITQIPKSAFQGCTGLQTLNVGTLTSVGDYAFQNCASLTGLGLSSLTNIGIYAFNGCASLQSANLLSAQTIGQNAFEGCTALQSVQLPDGLTFVDAYVFEGCPSLQAVAIPEGIESIGYGAFRGCTQLSQVSLPSTLTIIGNYAFEGCTALETIQLPLGLQQIDPQAFLGAGLTSIVVPNTVTNIGEGAFGGCWNLQSITLPFVGNTVLSSSDNNQYPLGFIFGETSVEYVEPSTSQIYYETPFSLTQQSYYIPSSLTSVTVTGGSILGGAFYNCSNLEEIILEEGVTGIYAYAFQNNSSLTRIVLPNSVEFIDEYAFGYCSSLESIVLPADLQYIKADAFNTCDNLQAVYYGDTQAQWANVTIYDTSLAFTNADVYFYSETRPATAENCWHYTPEGEIVIWEPGSDGLLFKEYDTYYTVTGYEGTDTEVFIPATHNGKQITQIAQLAFANNTQITAVHLPEHLQIIEYNAFQNALFLNTVFLPQGIQYIYSSAFNGCTSLTRAYYYGSVQSWQNVTVGANNSALSSNIYCYSEQRPETEGNFWVYKEDGSIRIWGLGTEGLQFTMWNGTYGVSGYTGTDTEIVIPDTYQGVAVTAIGGRAFEDRVDITSVELGVNVESIGVCAFINCTSLQTIVFNDNLRVIYDEAFRGCNAFTEFEIPASVTQLGFGIFSGWNKLERLTLQFMGGSEKTENDTYQYPLGYLFGAQYFSGSVTTEQFFPQSSATSYDSLTYYIPSSLQHVTLKRGHLSLGAFYNCTNLVSVTLEDEVTGIGRYAFFNCTSLTDIDLGQGIQSIDYLAFKNCRSLTNIVVPTSVTSIADGAFSLCVGLEEITLPFVGNSAKTSSQTYQYPFGYIFGLASDSEATATTQYYYGSSTSSTTSSTYYIPTSLRKVTILGGNILRGAFQNCAIETIIFGENVGSIYSYAFQNATVNNFAYKGSAYEWTGNRTISSTGNAILSSASFFYNYGATMATYSFVTDNGEDITPIQSSEIITLPTPTKEGYEFKGWYTNSSFTGTAYFTSFYAAQDTVLYAKWESSADGTSFAKAFTVSTGSVTVNIQTGGQRVYFKFVPTSTRTYTIYSTGTYDAYGYLYNASQSQLTYDDDNGTSSNFRISYTLTAGNTYYIVARMWSSSTTGSYTMTIS